jgi:hypothetical protein
MENTMSHRRTAAAVALSAVVLATAGCANADDDAGTATATATADASDTASSSAAKPSEAVVAHAEAYAALVDHPAYVRVQSAEPELLPAFVDEVTHGKLSATSNGNMWTFTDVAGECATRLSTDDTGGEIYKTTCAGVVVDEEFEDALREALASS